jgi:hypothetical protein
LHWAFQRDEGIRQIQVEALDKLRAALAEDGFNRLAVI